MSLHLRVAAGLDHRVDRRAHAALTLAVEARQLLAERALNPPPCASGIQRATVSKLQPSLELTW